MFRFYQSRIKKLINDSSDRFIEFVSRVWGCEAPEELVADLKSLITLSASLLKRIYILWPKLGKHSKLRNIETYLFPRFNGPDILAADEQEVGLFAYLDEAYLIALTYELIIEELLDKKVKVYGHDRFLLKEAARLRRKAKVVIASEVSKINMTLGELIEGESDSLNELLDQQKVA
ncbi:MAG: hypothetical protein WCT36_05985 [Candidatus Gracilibacteria bacterium]